VERVEKMIYVLGDSFSFGWNFWQDSNLEREKIIYSHHLSQILGDDVTNLSIPGGSNYRISRVLNDLNLTEKDTVVIAWTSSERLETGYCRHSIFPNDKVFDFTDIRNLENTLDRKKATEILLNGFEKQNNMFIARLRPRMLNQINFLTSNPLKKFTELLYKTFYNRDYLESMFLVLFNSAVYKCQKSNCKFIMFNSFCSTYSKNNDDLKIKNYILGYEKDMTSFLRPKIQQSKNYSELDYRPEYWNQDEHRKVAEIIYNNLASLYSMESKK
jgi:hypothetical protein